MALTTEAHRVGLQRVALILVHWLNGKSTLAGSYKKETVDDVLPLYRSNIYEIHCRRSEREWSAALERAAKAEQRASALAANLKKLHDLKDQGVV